MQGNYWKKKNQDGLSSRSFLSISEDVTGVESDAGTCQDDQPAKDGDQDGPALGTLLLLRLGVTADLGTEINVGSVTRFQFHGDILAGCGIITVGDGHADGVAAFRDILKAK